MCCDPYSLTLSQKLQPQTLYHIPILPRDPSSSCIHRRSYCLNLPLLRVLWTPSFLGPYSLPSDILSEEESDIYCLPEKKTHHHHDRIMIGQQQSKTPSFPLRQSDKNRMVSAGVSQCSSVIPHLEQLGLLTWLLFTRGYDAFWKKGTAKKTPKPWETLTKPKRCSDD